MAGIYSKIYGNKKDGAEREITVHVQHIATNEHSRSNYILSVITCIASAPLHL
jgi:hypothetical protein